jgi:hypothetical protein
LNDCDGINREDFGVGQCTNKFKGCFCLTTCGPTPGPCNKNGCNGQNGFCRSGAFNGCSCV